MSDSNSVAAGEEARDARNELGIQLLKSDLEQVAVKAVESASEPATRDEPARLHQVPI